MEHQTHEKVIGGVGILLLVIGVAAGYWFGYPKGFNARVAQEKAEQKAREEALIAEAAKAVNPFENTATNPFEETPANPYQNIKINPFE